MNDTSIQVKYLYHGVHAADAESVLRHGLLTRKTRLRSGIASVAHNFLSNDDGIYLSDFMAIPFAWGIGKGAPTQQPGIILRIPIMGLSLHAFRPGQYFLVHYLQKIGHTDFINSLKPKLHLQQHKAQWLAWQFSCVVPYLDEYAFLWEASLLEVGELIYRRDIGPHQFSSAIAPDVNTSLTTFDRTHTRRLRSPHLQQLQRLFDGGSC